MGWKQDDNDNGNWLGAGGMPFWVPDDDADGDQPGFGGLGGWRGKYDEPGSPDYVQPVAVFEFESGTRCDVCGKQHADQWHCDPSIPNPWKE